MDLSSRGLDDNSVREALAWPSAGSDAQQALEDLFSAQDSERAAPARISFIDHFAGTSVSLSHIPLLPDEQAALVQVTRPLQLMRAAAWFLGRRWQAAGDGQQQAASVSGSSRCRPSTACVTAVLRVCQRAPCSAGWRRHAGGWPPRLAMGRRGVSLNSLAG